MSEQRLTPSERAVVALVCEGLTNPQIAERLSVSPRTVQGHLLKVFKKLNVSSRTQLATSVVRAQMRARPEHTNELDPG